MISLYLFLNIHAPFKNEHSKNSGRTSIYPIERIKMAYKNIQTNSYIPLCLLVVSVKIQINTFNEILVLGCFNAFNLFFNFCFENFKTCCYVWIF